MSYFMADDDLVTLPLECGESITVTANLSAGKLMELTEVNKDNPQGMSRDLLQTCIKSWTFARDLSIEAILDLKLSIFTDLLQKVMAQYDIPFE